MKYATDHLDHDHPVPLLFQHTDWAVLTQSTMDSHDDRTVVRIVHKEHGHEDILSGLTFGPFTTESGRLVSSAEAAQRFAWAHGLLAPIN